MFSRQADCKSSYWYFTLLPSSVGWLSTGRRLLTILLMACYVCSLTPASCEQENLHPLSGLHDHQNFFTCFAQWTLHRRLSAAEPNQVLNHSQDHWVAKWPHTLWERDLDIFCEQHCMGTFLTIATRIHWELTFSPSFVKVMGKK